TAMVFCSFLIGMYNIHKMLITFNPTINYPNCHLNLVIRLEKIDSREKVDDGDNGRLYCGAVFKKHRSMSSLFSIIIFNIFKNYFCM
ncbi:hypothetical protein L9F63_006308, partial [Diploptera punctata]